MEQNITSKAAVFVAAAGAFGLGHHVHGLEPVPGAALLLTLGLALALAVSGHASSWAIVAGALGAFAYGVTLPTSAIVAGALLVALAYAERTIRVRDRIARAVHVGLAAGAGALAGATMTQFAGASLSTWLIGLVVVSVLVAVPQLIEADDPIAHTLDDLARDLDGPVRDTLHDGATLRRTSDPTLFDKKTDKQAQRAWSDLVRIAQARVRIARYAPAPRRAEAATKTATANDNAMPVPRASHLAVKVRLDNKIQDHVNALARMYAAVDEAKAAEMTLDDEAMRILDSQGETLEEISKAIVNEVG